MDARRYYLDGPGETLVVASDYDATNPSPDKIIAIVSSKSAVINYQPAFEKVTGGEGLTPRRKFITERVVTFEMEDCEMDYRYFSLSQGEEIKKGSTTAWAYGSDEITSIGDDGTVTLSATPVADTLIFFDDGGSMFTESATPVAGSKFSLDGAVASFDLADKGRTVSPIYQYSTDEDTESVGVKSDSIPKTCKLIHRMKMFDNNNKRKGTQQLEFFLAEVGAEFAEDYREKTPATARMTFEVLDPMRPDKKILDKKWIPAKSS